MTYVDSMLECMSFALWQPERVITIIIKRVLLAVAQSRSLPGAPVIESCDESRDGSPDESHDESRDESHDESPDDSHD